MDSRRGSAGSMKTFEIPHKDTPWEVLEQWRKATLVLNASRRFRYTANVKKRRDADEKRKKFKATGQVVRAAFRFIDAGIGHAPAATAADEENAKKHGFQITPQTLASLGDRSAQESALKNLGGIDGLAQKLQIDYQAGVSDKDLDRRQQAFGSNTYEEKPPKGFLIFVWEAMHDLTLAILAFCALISFVVGIATEGWKEGWYDGAGIGLSILLVVFVTAASDYQQSLQFRALDKEKKNISIQVTRNRRRCKISIFDLVVGDVVHLSIGDQVPADGIFVSGYCLLIDESSMTGESEPQAVNKSKPFLLSGTKVQDGSAIMVVTGVGMNTEWGHLMAVLGEGGDDETPLQVRLNGVATLIGKIGLGFAILTFLVLLIRFLVEKSDLSSWSGDDVLQIVNYFAIAVTIIVVAVPEGLPLAVTLTLAYAMKKMMKDKALVRHLSACETMGSATCICSDKTGTLTTNQMTVVKSWIGDTIRSESDGSSEISEPTNELLLQNCFQNTSGDVADGKDGKPGLIGTPTETAVLAYAAVHLGGDFKQVRSRSSILKVEPFNSAKKRMGVLLKNCDDGCVRAHWKGASEIVLGMCDKYLDAGGEVRPIDERKHKELKGVIRTFADEALRTLCLAYRDLESEPEDHAIPESGFICLGIVGIKDPVRPGVREAVQLCFAAGIKVRMVTGDNINTAVAIARECGILTDGEAIEGPEFRQLSQEQMRDIIPSLQVMARSSPTDKHTLVKELRALGEVVSVTGDGTNDAPALHEADVGLAMGISGTEVAKESADIVILDDKFNTIVVVAKWGRSVYTNIQKFVQFQLTVNLVALVLNFTSACITGQAPLTAVQLLWVNLIMDTLGALALATEPPTDDLMKRAPVGRKGSFISNVMWRNIAIQAVYQLIILNVLQYQGKAILGYDSSETLRLNTLIFNVFVFCQVFNEVNARDMEKLNVFKHTFNNKTFLLVLLFTVVFQVVLVEFLGKLADTTPLNAKEWAISICIGLLSMPIAAIGKFIPVPSESCFTSSSEPEEDHDGYQPLPQNAA